MDINNSTTIDGATISLDATDSSNFTVTGNSASPVTLTLGATNSGGAGTGNVVISAESALDLTATKYCLVGNTYVDGGTVSIDATNTMNINLKSGNHWRSFT